MKTNDTTSTNLDIGNDTIIAQLEPDRNYPEDIFDKFPDLMHISDYKHRLLTKVWIVSLLVPDIPHPINITFGEKGSSKSTFCRFVKRLVDPDKIELLTVPKDRVCTAALP